MSERKTADDYVEMVDAAIHAIGRAVHDGERKHQPGSWLGQTVDEQLKHIEAHITAYGGGDPSEDHPAHIVCRAAIAVALRRRLQKQAVQPVPESALPGAKV